MNEKEKMRLLIKDTISEIDQFNKEITNLQLDINKMSPKNDNRYFLMCNEVKFPYENYDEGFFIATHKSSINAYSNEQLQDIAANTQKTLKKFMMLREIAVNKINMLITNNTGGKNCG